MIELIQEKIPLIKSGHSHCSYADQHTKRTPSMNICIITALDTYKSRAELLMKGFLEAGHSVIIMTSDWKHMDKNRKEKAAAAFSFSMGTFIMRTAWRRAFLQWHSGTRKKSRPEQAFLPSRGRTGPLS